MRPHAHPTIVLLPQTVDDEGANDEEPEEDDAPEEDEDNDSDSEHAGPEIPLPEVETINNDGEQDRVLSDDNELYGENTQAEGTVFDDEGVRRSTRHTFFTPIVRRHKVGINTNDTRGTNGTKCACSLLLCRHKKVASTADRPTSLFPFRFLPEALVKPPFSTIL